MGLFKRSSKSALSQLQNYIGDYELPSFPAIVMSVLSDLRDPDVTMTEIAKKLQSDPGLHVKTLKTVNSAAFGFSVSVNDIFHAVNLLGKSRLETIVLSHAVNKSLPNVELPFMKMKEFWNAAARKACLARLLAKKIHPSTQMESFTAGLLQDMALPILVTVKTVEYEVIFERLESDAGASLEELEREFINVDHSAIGGLIAEQWGLPEYLINAISNHHNELKNEIESAIQVVSFLRWDNEDTAINTITDVAQDAFGIKKEAISEMIKVAFEEADTFSHAFV
ncbi:HDOD domain-containing protein [Gemmatimonadota bacterium]